MSTPAAIAHAAHLLRQGQLVAMPTETVYGLAADATNTTAVARIYATKGRPAFNPLIIHVPSYQAATELGAFSPAAQQLAEAFWPGPLTLVVPYIGTTISPLARAGLATVGLRVPAHPVAQELLAACGCPLAAPSANRSGQVSATLPAHIEADFGTEVPILPAGPSPVGIESTIISTLNTTLTLLRPGAITPEAIAARGLTLAPHTPLSPTSPLAPGQLASHYAPRAPVRLNATQHEAGNAWLTFGTHNPALASAPSINLSPTADITEAASNLFAALRELDSRNPTAIAVVPLPTHGLGLAVADRLTRAAAPR